MCIYVLKEIINMYVQQNTPIFICFLDASKAFDRVNHYTLFEKLIKRGLPIFIVRVLCFWYRSQQVVIKWGNSTSRCFHVTNSVRQGGIMSPKLYNVYIDELSVRLSKNHIGPFIGQVRANHLSFADDMNLIGTTTQSLQTLINCCDEYAKENDILYNALKTKCMYIIPRKYKNISFGDLNLRGTTIERVDKIKYLGHIMSSCNTDDLDIENSKYLFYARVNSLISKFQCCSDSVKRQLFQSFCSSFYCCALWINHKAKTMYDLKVAYNNGFRKLMRLPYNCSASEMFFLNRVDALHHLIRKSCFNLMTRLTKSENNIVRCMIDNDIPKRSSFWTHWKLVLHMDP